MVYLFNFFERFCDRHEVQRVQTHTIRTM